jgi:membrane protein implicated in regulation of membrane protease activity
MFWTFLLIAALALVFMKLGAYSVLVALLSGGLQLALFIIFGLVIAMLWRKIFPKNN